MLRFGSESCLTSIDDRLRGGMPHSSGFFYTSVWQRLFSEDAAILNLRTSDEVCKGVKKAMSEIEKSSKKWLTIDSEFDRKYKRYYKFERHQ